jgi:hypothetical protein
MNMYRHDPPTTLDQVLKAAWMWGYEQALRKCKRSDVLLPMANASPGPAGKDQPHA